MIRQFGLPTFFIALSAAETRWPKLVVLLKPNVDRIELILIYNLGKWRPCLGQTQWRVLDILIVDIGKFLN